MAKNMTQPNQSSHEGFFEGWRKHWRPRLAWLAIGAFVTLYDATCPKGETLSEEAERAMEHPLGKLAVHALVWTTAGHLTRVIPEKYDWIHKLVEM